MLAPDMGGIFTCRVASGCAPRHLNHETSLKYHILSIKYRLNTAHVCIRQVCCVYVWVSPNSSRDVAADDLCVAPDTDATIPDTCNVISGIAPTTCVILLWWGHRRGFIEQDMPSLFQHQTVDLRWGHPVGIVCPFSVRCLKRIFTVGTKQRQTAFKTIQQTAVQS